MKRPTTPEVRGPFPDDAMLRKHGFKVVSHSKDNVRIWRRGEREYTQTQALEVARFEEESLLEKQRSEK